MNLNSYRDLSRHENVNVSSKGHQLRKALIVFGLYGILAVAENMPGMKVVGKPDHTAGRTPVLVELFTSEGCSSCPPADQLLTELDQKQPFPDVDLIVLSEHVDYWNGSGWIDPYSSILFTERQNRYVRQFRLESAYTPQRVVDGQLEGVGNNVTVTKSDIERAGQFRKVPMMLSNIMRSGNQIQLHVTAAEIDAEANKAMLYIAVAEDRAQSDVRRGENAGRSLTHVGVVRSLVQIGTVKSGVEFSKDMNLKMPASVNSLSSSMRLVAFLQVEKTLKIIGATQVKL